MGERDPLVHFTSGAGAPHANFLRVARRALERLAEPVDPPVQRKAPPTKVGGALLLDVRTEGVRTWSGRALGHLGATRTLSELPCLDVPTTRMVVPVLGTS